MLKRNVKYVKTIEQLSDPLTKGSCKQKFQSLIYQIEIRI